MAYRKDGAEHTFTFQSDNLDYTGTTSNPDYTTGTVPYLIRAFLAEAPLNSVDSNGVMTFGNKCLSPYSFEGATQTPAGPTHYDGVATPWQLTPFAIDPPGCQHTVVYEVVSIVDPQGYDDNIDTFDLYVDEQAFNFDGIVDGQGDDGTINFTVELYMYDIETYEPGDGWEVTV